MGALGSSESPVGVSEGGKGRFLPATFMGGAFFGVGSVVVWISSCGVSGELVEKPVSEIPAFVSITVAVGKAAPVRGSLACLDFFFFFLVVAVCPPPPAVMVNRVRGAGKENGHVASRDRHTGMFL